MNFLNDNHEGSRMESPAADPQSPADPSNRTAPWWVAATLAALIVGVLFVTVHQYQANSALAQHLENTNELLATVEARTGVLEAELQGLRSVAGDTAAKLDTTAEQLKRTRYQTSRLGKMQAEAKTELSSRLEEHNSRIESITGEVTDVKEEVAETQESLADTRVQLTRAMGDLGLQSGLIARNHDELEELRRRGERDYVEFDLRKAKKYSPVGNLSVRLNKTDAKRSKYTLTVLFNDKMIEKKDKTLYEPVQFYTHEQGQLLELVVFELGKDRVAGYLSSPKQQIAENRPLP